MQFGVHFQLSCAANQLPTSRYRETIEQAMLAEALGFESIWPVEQHFEPEASVSPAPMLLLAAIASRTATIRLGTAVTLLPLAHPVRVAEEVATLDVISGGRAECGVGRGMDPAHFAGLGVPHAESSPRFLEAIAVVRQALGERRFSHHGTFHQLDDVTVVPRPVQHPHPPIRIAANSPATFQIAGRLGMPIIAATHINPLPQLTTLIAHYRKTRRAAGHADGADDVTVLAPTFTCRTIDEVRRHVDPGLEQIAAVSIRRLDTWLRSAPAGDEGAAQRARLTELRQAFRRLDVETMAGERAIFGTPGQCVERLHAIGEELGADRVICWFEPGGVIPHEHVAEAMMLFSREVMPALRGHRGRSIAA